MNKTYDIIIAGAGPAGAQCARYLTEHSKYSVLLLDKTHELGEPKKSTAGVPAVVMKDFKLPKKIAMWKIKSAVIESPAEEVEIPLDAYVLEFGKFKKYLTEQAIHNGADVKIGATVTKLILEGKKIAGVTYTDFDGVNTVRAKLIIDATGPPAILATQLGLRKLNPKNHWVGLEFEMDRLHLKHQRSFLIKLDHTYAPGGYSWIFSTGKNHAKVGNCWNLDNFKKRKGKRSQTDYLEKWIQSDDRLKNGIAMEIHAGDAYVNPNVRKRSTDNFMAIGDVVCSIHPWFGEGIRPALHSAVFAAKTAITALKKSDYSARQLKNYDKMWKDRLGKYYGTAGFLSRKFYALSNSKFDKFARNMRKLDKSTIKKITDNKFTLKDAMKMLVGVK